MSDKKNPQEIWRAGITMEEEKEAVNMAIEALKEPKQGEWIVKNDEMEVFCSVCDKPLPCSDEYDYETNYCPNCGARMRGDEK